MFVYGKGRAEEENLPLSRWRDQDGDRKGGVLFISHRPSTLGYGTLRGLYLAAAKAGLIKTANQVLSFTMTWWQKVDWEAVKVGLSTDSLQASMVTGSSGPRSRSSSSTIIVDEIELGLGL